MAHKGNPAPVAFRRDFNLNVDTNDDGFANRYLIRTPQLPPGIGGGLDTRVWDCGPSTVNPQGVMFWQSDPELIIGFVFAATLRATIVNGSSYKKEFLYFEAVSGVILTLELVNDPAPRAPEFPPFQTWKTTQRDGFFFTADGFANQVNAFKKRWTDGPPH